MLGADHAFDVFLHAFARTRSVVSPAECGRIGTLPVIRDVPGHRRTPRGQEIMVPTSVDVGEAVEIVAANRPSTGFAVCVLRCGEHDGKEAIALMKRSGFRYMRSEPLMIRSTSEILPVSTAIAIRRVSTAADAAAVAKFMGHRVTTESELNEYPPTCRVYLAELDGKIVSYARSVDSILESAYLAGMYTDADFRRRGIATAVLATALADDARFGAKFNVLLASKAGEQLYLSMGYAVLGHLYMFMPAKERRERSVQA